MLYEIYIYNIYIILLFGTYPVVSSFLLIFYELDKIVISLTLEWVPLCRK